MNSLRSRASAAALAALVSACASTSGTLSTPTEPPPAPRTASQIPTEPDVIAEQADPRTRAKAHTDLAAAYYELGNMSVALEEVRVALAADSSYAPAYSVQGLVYMDLKDVPAAQSSFERAMRLAPGDPDILHNYGWFLCQTGREDQSIAYFTRAVASPLYRAPAKSYAAAGQCAKRRGDDAEAAGYFDRALRLDANNVTALLPYAEILYRGGRYNEAKALVARFNQLVEPTPESLWLQLRLDRRLGDRAGETATATQLRRRFPNSNEYREFMQGKFE